MAYHEQPFPSIFDLKTEKEIASNITDYQKKASHLTSVIVNSVIFLLVYLPRPCKNLRDLYNLLSRAEQYLLQVMQSYLVKEAHTPMTGVTSS